MKDYPKYIQKFAQEVLEKSAPIYAAFCPCSKIYPIEKEAQAHTLCNCSSNEDDFYDL